MIQEIDTCNCVDVAVSLCKISIITIHLLPTGSEERGVVGVGSILVAIHPSCQNMKTIALYLHRYEYSWVEKIKKHLRGSTQDTTLSLIIILTAALWALVSIIA